MAPWRGDYSRRPHDLAAARAFPLTTLDRPDDGLPRHGEVAAAIGGIARAVAPVLNSVAKDCYRGEPDLSALVPSSGAARLSIRVWKGRSSMSGTSRYPSSFHARC